MMPEARPQARKAHDHKGSLPDSREACEAWDAADPLASLRAQFELPPHLIYLDGNSLGPLPRHTPARIQDAVTRQWGQGLIRSWNDADWIGLPQRVGAKIAGLIGAHADEVIAADSTSVNLFKLLAGALALRPGRRTILSEQGNFPTDLYIAQGLAQLAGGHRVRTVPREQLLQALDADTAVLMLTQVDYRDGACLDIAEVSATAHQAGALVLWDLAHSAGALPLSLSADEVDLAVGCGYKYLNGGPGAPAFAYVARRWQEGFRQPLAGWLGHAAPFAFEPDYRPAPGIQRLVCGTPPVLSMIALEAGLDCLLQAEPLGGVQGLRTKSLQLGDLFIEQVQRRCAGHGLHLLTPLEHARRGSQISWRLPDEAGGGEDHSRADGSGSRENGGGRRGQQAYAVMQALIARGVIGDFRAPDVLRFGIAPAYLRAVDIWDAVTHLAQVLDTRAWQDPRFGQRRAVT